jgi:hypothetical protein
MKFAEIKLLSYDEDEICAGALACAHGYLACGTFVGGYAIWEYPSLRLIKSNSSLFEGGCNGIQLAENGILCLGNDTGNKADFGKPPDFSTSLKLISYNSYEVVSQIQLGPGLWHLVKGITSNIAVLCNSINSFDNGVLAVDTTTGSTLWQIKTKYYPRLTI